VTIQLSRRTVALALAAFVALTAIATTSLVLTLTSRADASHRFGDIGNTNFFHDSTAWLKDNGIATGFGDGTFRPNSNITRGQASFWFANNNNAIEILEGGVDAGAGTTEVTAGRQCPTGKRPVAGGARHNESNFFISESYPDGQIWWTTLETENDTPIDPGLVRVWALCVPNTIP
jgi:hypothetical protein